MLQCHFYTAGLAAYITLEPMNSVIDSTATDFLNAIGAAIHECDLPASSKVRAAASCLAISQDHHHGIVILLDHQRYSSAFALVRVALEAYVRGEWLAACASDEQVDCFWNGEEPPRFGELLAQLEATETFEAMVLSKIKKIRWRQMCAYTHTGGLHIQRWNTEGGIEPNYSEQEIREVLSFAETIGALAVIGVASLASDVSAATRVLELFRRRMGA